MRVGQKNGLVYQWAKKGTRPRQPKDQRYANAYLFGAVCPARDTDAALVHATRRHRGHAEAPRRDQPQRRRRRPGGADSRQGRLAHDRQARAYRPTSPSSSCHRQAPSSIQPRTSGSTCARPTSRTACSTATRPSARRAAKPGTRSAETQDASHPSPPEPGPPSVRTHESRYYPVPESGQ